MGVIGTRPLTRCAMSRLGRERVWKWSLTNNFPTGSFRFLQPPLVQGSSTASACSGTVFLLEVRAGGLGPEPNQGGSALKSAET